jgi:NAD(P)-dependent dehydrogenase (short-subunit alcohol dehydrogenase family)
MKFKDRVAFITGASRGVGKCIALALAREGCDIIARPRPSEADARIPGTIRETAAEVEKLGGAPGGAGRRARRRRVERGVKQPSTRWAASTFSSTTPARCTGAPDPRRR